MAGLTFCIDTNRRDLENARMVAIWTNEQGVDEIKPPCDNQAKKGKEPVRSLRSRSLTGLLTLNAAAFGAVGLYGFCNGN
jgi:hypothetical protein